MSDKLISTELPVQKNPNESSLEDGWHIVARSDAIKNGEALQVDDFATQLVVWRGEDGKVRALDLYCKHMGAALSCGEVDGNGIRCPFHAWKWNEEGNCDDIPYAKKIPTKAVTRSWQVKEESNDIMVMLQKA